MSTLAITSTDDTSASVALDGGMQFWAGLSYGTASFIQYLVLTGRLHLPHPAMIGLVWMAASIAFLVFGVFWKLGSDPLLLKDPSHRRFRAVWVSLILGAFVIIAALGIMLHRLDPALNLNMLTAPIALCVYGIGWRAAAVMTARSWPNLLSLGAFAGAVMLAFLAGTPEQSLGYTLGLLAFAVVPGGLLLLRR